MEIVCTLGTTDRADQAERWGRLIARAGTGREETPTGVQLRFRPGAGVAEELEALAATERECCAWATWTVATGRDGVVLDIASSGEGIAALRSMFTSALA
jgi:hypothetical protein